MQRDFEVLRIQDMSGRCFLVMVPIASGVIMTLLAMIRCWISKKVQVGLSEEYNFQPTLLFDGQ